MAVDRRQMVMGGAAGVLLILALWQLWPAAPVDPVAAGSAATPRGSAPAGAAVLKPTAPLKLDTLRASREGPGDAERNPFRFQPKAPPPAPKAPVTAAPPPSDIPRVVLPPPGPPPAAPIPLKLIGVLERANGVKWAVLTDGKSGPMYGKDGDIIDGRYMIVKIGTESIEMTHADGRGRQVIRLSGQ